MHVSRPRIPTSPVQIAVIVALSLAVFGIAFFSTNNYVDSDPLGCLLTSQAILSHRTIKLDGYQEMLKKYEHLYSYRIIQRNNNLYHLLPLGTSVYAVPFVALANAYGRDMSAIVNGTPLHDKYLQKVLSSAIVAICFLLVYMICRVFTGPVSSVFLSLTFTLGSPLMSTMGTALWSFDFEVLFILASLLLIVLDAQERQKLNMYCLSFFLFSAYLCRPTAALFIVSVIFYVAALKSRKELLRLIAGLAFLSILFVGFSLYEYRSILPPYYLPHRITGSKTFWTALYGNLFSPARGLFVYSPYLLVTLAGIAFFFKTVRRSPLFWLVTAWFILHVLSVSRFPHWWGGEGFGPRLSTDVFPSFILLTLLVWNASSNALSRVARHIAIAIFCCFSAAGIVINTYQGLYNHATMVWHHSPTHEAYREHLFDWGYPQFAATWSIVRERESYHVAKQLEPFHHNSSQPFDSQSLHFENWHAPEPGFRWSSGTSSKIYCRLTDTAHLPARVTLTFTFFTFDKQILKISLNETALLTTETDGKEATISIPVNSSLLKDGTNVIHFQVPGAHSPGNSDPRILGVALRSLSLH